MHHLRTLAAVAACLACTCAAAQNDPALREAARLAVETNPEVTARVSALRAGQDAVDVAGSGLLPQVDLEAGVARTEDRLNSRTPPSGRLDQTGVALVARQLLWDGRATGLGVRRAEHERLLRWYELADVTEQTALEAARAHFDVLRFRRLVELAEENYVQHKYVQGQLESRVGAGVQRGADLEQANARLALAEANLTTEIANLHDVSARYARVVGVPPPATLRFEPMSASGLPADAAEAATLATRDNVAISASIEALRAARATEAVARSAYQPRVEARLRAGGGHNYEGLADQTRSATAQIVLNWSLYAGGGDQARISQRANLLTQAADLRDQTCREVRQTAAIAYSDIGKLGELLPALDRNTLAIEKARDAYYQQFDIAQRSLLDLLNAENELYAARRAYVNADFDLSIARARTLAATQQLVPRLGLAVAVPAPPAVADGAGEADLPQRCPVQTLPLGRTSRAELDARAQRLIRETPPPAVTPGNPPGPTTPR